MTDRRGSGSLARLLGVVLLLGVAAGLLWYFLAPTPEYRVEGAGLFFATAQPSEFIAMDGWFAGLTLLAGLASGVLAVRRGLTGPLAMVVLAAGGLLASTLAWQLGHALGPGEASLPQRPVVGTVVHGPLDLEALGVLPVRPIAALAVVLLVLGWRVTEPDDEPGSVPRDPDLGDVDRRE